MDASNRDRRRLIAAIRLAVRGAGALADTPVVLGQVSDMEADLDRLASSLAGRGPADLADWIDRVMAETCPDCDGWFLTGSCPRHDPGLCVLSRCPAAIVRTLRVELGLT